MAIQAFVLRRYKIPLVDGLEFGKEGSKQGIREAENVGIVLSDEITPQDSGKAYEKAVIAILGGKLSTILTEETNPQGTRLYQQVIKQGGYTYFLEKAPMLIV